MDTDTRTEAPPARAADAGPVAEIRFPEVEGRRSTTASCRAIIADAARVADPALAARIESCENWRRGYVSLMGELTALGADTPAALAMAAAGIDSMRRRLVLESDAEVIDLGGAAAAAGAGSPLGTGELRGGGVRAERLEVPYRGRSLHGRELLEQLASWERDGLVEPSFAAAVGLVAEHPEWLSLPGRTVALIGAGAEIGPLEPLCAWGADLLAVDLPSERVWARLSETIRRGAGTVRLPVSTDGTAGADVLADLARTRAWLEQNLTGTRPVLGMYGYADGGAHVLLTGAFDVLAGSLAAAAGEAPALAFLATPTDAYLVPAHDVERASAAYRARRLRAVAQAPLKLLSGNRLYRPAYSGQAPVADALVEQQGPNYAVAKRLQRWRGLLADAAGERVSFNVAPATWTRSVTKNKVLAAAYGGARHFGIEIFEPRTTRVLMAALLVHDLNREPPADRRGEQLFSEGAGHGGLWTAAYEVRSALGLAALAGLPATVFGGAHRPADEVGGGGSGTV